MKFQIAFTAILIYLNFGCVKNSKPEFENERHRLIEVGKQVLKDNSITPENYPEIEVRSSNESWIIFFSERSPHPPGTDLTVYISKKDGTVSLIKGE
jgi:hypothetical protein